MFNTAIEFAVPLVLLALAVGAVLMLVSRNFRAGLGLIGGSLLVLGCYGAFRLCCGTELPQNASILIATASFCIILGGIAAELMAVLRLYPDSLE